MQIPSPRRALMRSPSMEASERRAADDAGWTWFGSPPKPRELLERFFAPRESVRRASYEALCSPETYARVEHDAQHPPDPAMTVQIGGQIWPALPPSLAPPLIDKSPATDRFHRASKEFPFEVLYETYRKQPQTTSYTQHICDKLLSAWTDLVGSEAQRPTGFHRAPSSSGREVEMRVPWNFKPDDPVIAERRAQYDYDIMSNNPPPDPWDTTYTREEEEEENNWRSSRYKMRMLGDNPLTPQRHPKEVYYMARSRRDRKLWNSYVVLDWRDGVEILSPFHSRYLATAEQRDQPAQGQRILDKGHCFQEWRQYFCLRNQRTVITTAWHATLLHPPKEHQEAVQLEQLGWLFPLKNKGWSSEDQQDKQFLDDLAASSAVPRLWLYEGNAGRIEFVVYTQGDSCDPCMRPIDIFEPIYGDETPS